MSITKNPFSEKQSDQQREAIIDFDPATTALLVVDMLKDFFVDGGAMVLEGGEALYAPHRKLLAAARAAGMPVLWLNQSLPPDDSLFEMRTVHCLAGSWAPKSLMSCRSKTLISSSPNGVTAASSRPRSISPCANGVSIPSL